MTPESLRALLDYHYWSRDRLLGAVERIAPEQFRQNLASSSGSIRDTLVHVVSAESLWRSRWQGDCPGRLLNVTDFQTVHDSRALWGEEARLRESVYNLGPRGAEQVVHHNHFDGQPMNSVLWKILQHLVNHATFHRGQVTTMLRQLGAEPPRSPDMIAFYQLDDR